jgi:nitroreductase
MEFQDTVRKRRMVRNFEDRPVAPGLVDRILANALRGPSAGFSQGFEFLVLEGVEQTDHFWKVVSPGREWEKAGWPGVYNAPLIIVPFSHKQTYIDRYAEPDKPWQDRDESHWPVPYWHIDTGFATMLILLTAVDAGLGALFFGLFDPPALRAAYDIPDGYDPIGAIAIGHPVPDRRSGSLRRGHRPQAQVVHRGGW